MLIMAMEDLGLMGEPNVKKVPDGIQNLQSIFELEDKFDNSGHKQGMKYSSEQRMKTLGY